ncbi:MAG: serine--tRNA ligase [SAR86 cluster bacterium]|jgi:seryl-tRNA synthetase|nr:serine--tRNA ligase [SAR86 cluster bacterium]
MIDQKLLKNSINECSQSLKKRGYHLDIETWNKLEAKRASLQVKFENQQAELNNISKQIGLLKSKNEGTTELEEIASYLSEDIKEQSSALDLILDDLNLFLLEIPNIPDQDVPEGDNENDNLLIREWGNIPKFDFLIKDHVELGEMHGLLDFESASQITGSRFVVMKDSFAKLQRALIQFMLDTHVNLHGYTEVYVPYIVSSKSLEGTGQLPKFEEDLFRIEGDQNFYLSPTAEVPVTNLFRDTILDFKDLPTKYVCHTPCFRSEAGSYGKDTKGIMRQHQFEKVELVKAVEPQDSSKALEDITNDAESILQALEMPYRVVSLCGKDLGFASAKTYDIEVWVPSQNTYREISSCSNYRDFQARRMKARWRSNETKKPQLINTLNGSGLAIGRTLLSLLELNQNEDGSISLPKVLHNYMNVKTIMPT